MHGISCIDRSSGPGDLHSLTLRRIELHIPLPFPFLQYIKVILELLIIILSSNGQVHCFALPFFKKDVLGPSSNQLVYATIERSLKDQSYYGCDFLAQSFKTMGRIASGPAALETLRPEKSLFIPALEILMYCIMGNLHCRGSDRRSTREIAPFNIVVWQSFIRLRGDRLEKTDWN